jgi:hypothetical protein
VRHRILRRPAAQGKADHVVVMSLGNRSVLSTIVPPVPTTQPSSPSAQDTPAVAPGRAMSPGRCRSANTDGYAERSRDRQY